MTHIRDFGPVRFIQGLKGGRYPHCNSLYIKEAGLLIDPSSDREYLKQLKVNTVWLSHWHEDHLMDLDLFDDKLLGMHEADTFPLAAVENFVNWYGLNDNQHEAIKERWVKMLTDLFHYKPRTPQVLLKDGEIIDLGSVNVEIIHAPGHTPGHLALFFREPEILFLGDYDMTPFGPWYGDRYSDIDQILTTLDRLKEIPARIWLTGHEDGVFEKNPGRIWEEYRGVIFRREEQLLELLKAPLTLEEIGKAWITYGKPVEPVQEFGLIEQLSMKKHAERLIRQGEVRFAEERYQAV